MHYFLECPAYTAHRDVMRRDLRDLLTPEQLTNKTELLYLIIHGNHNDSHTNNVKILKIVYEYINKTKRFMVD